MPAPEDIQIELVDFQEALDDLRCLQQVWFSIGIVFFMLFSVGNQFVLFDLLTFYWQILNKNETSYMTPLPVSINQGYHHISEFLLLWFRRLSLLCKRFFSNQTYIVLLLNNTQTLIWSNPQFMSIPFFLYVWYQNHLAESGWLLKIIFLWAQLDAL